ncbi:Inactive polyglycylase ttll10 [Saguinus oedipus]|uniref:Inactive polyglycylase ttll10 n=1 Tax=Saguinus oedipus TaxID=9490 RepID=A0ABQ9V894_SAGOE|nr:Inactive polyglycylase ttll10 [Saguinus oedipus]
MWICKPKASNQGKGIFLLQSQEEVAALQAKTQSIEDDPVYHKLPLWGPQARVVQRAGSGRADPTPLTCSAQQPQCGAHRYIQNPLLLDGRKFDGRSYLLIACVVPYMVFFGHGYARLTLSLYDLPFQRPQQPPDQPGPSLQPWDEVRGRFSPRGGAERVRL